MEFIYEYGLFLAQAVTLVAESPGRLAIARSPGGRRLAEGDRRQGNAPS